MSHVSSLMSYVLYLSVMNPQPVINHSDLVLFQIPGRRSLHGISTIEKNVLGTTDLAGCNRVTARNNSGLSGICFNDAVFESFVRTAGIISKILIITDADYNQSGITVRRKGHGVSRDHQIVVIDK